MELKKVEFEENLKSPCMACATRPDCAATRKKQSDPSIRCGKLSRFQAYTTKNAAVLSMYGTISPTGKLLEKMFGKGAAHLGALADLAEL